MELISELKKIKDGSGGYLPMEKVREMAEKWDMPLAEIISVASFYRFFYFSPEEKKEELERLYEERLPGILLTPPDPYVWDGYQKAKQFPGQALELLKTSGLCGRSGSGFPTARKWELTKQTASEEKYVVCNADEGEPGTGKDRILLEENPKAVLEGMAACAAIIGAHKGYLYLRGEYADLEERLNSEIKKAPFGNFAVELRLGQGAYICGEETALLESLENHRGEPRLKPPYPGVSGLYGKPTVINNVETFAAAACILSGRMEILEQTEESGTRLYTLCGAVKNPGVYEKKAGCSVRELLDAAGGMENGALPYAVQVGGGSGAILPGNCLEMRLAAAECREHGCMPGTGSVRFLARKEDVLPFVGDMTRFYAGESCGMCVPCRNGLAQLCRMMANVQDAEGWLDIRKLAQHIADNARCAFGRAAVTPVLSMLKHFPEVLV